jgi:hypothetical protein
MREFEVQYATKAAGPSGHPEKAVSEIAGTTWRMKREAAIGWLEVDAHTFYVKQGEQRIYLVVATHNAQSWLRTDKDWAQTNLLLSLPDCPAELD